MLTAATAGAAVARASRSHAITIAEARRAWAAKFRACGLDSPELDARLLIGHALSLDHAGLAAASARKLDAAEERAIAALAQRRLVHEPVARIIGTKEFWGLNLAIDAATLVPRPETETIVEAALAAVALRGAHARPLRIADLGTGCGAILLALLTELPYAFGVGTDFEPRRARRRASQCPPSWPRPPRGVCRLRHGGGPARSVRCDRLQPALYCHGRHYRTAARGPFV